MISLLKEFYRIGYLECRKGEINNSKVIILNRILFVYPAVKKHILSIV